MMQLSVNPANRKNATREIDLSSITVLEEANMDLITDGVTGIRRLIPLALEVSLPIDDEEPGP